MDKKFDVWNQVKKNTNKIDTKTLRR